MLEPSESARMPFRRWMSKFRLLVVGLDGGSVESQRTERSQASTRGIFEEGRGGWERAIVEIDFICSSLISFGLNLGRVDLVVDVPGLYGCVPFG